MSTRLTNDLRDAIASDILRHRFNEQVDALIADRAALASVSTIKRLIEAWPEVAPFAAKYEDAPRQLPSVPTEKLNEMLGLPVAA